MDFILVQERTWLLQHLTCLTFCSLLHLLVLFVDIFGEKIFLCSFFFWFWVVLGPVEYARQIFELFAYGPVGKYLFLTEGPLPNVRAAAISFLPSYFLMKQLLIKLCSPT